MKAFFVFSGQGAQTVGMGRDLYESSPAAKRVFDAADAALDWSVTDVCFNGPAEKLTESKYCQPAIYTTSCAALAAFQAKFRDIKPLACAGLSLGEYAALQAGNAFLFENGLKLVARRAELMDAACRATNGGMASVLGGDEAVIKEVCAASDIDVANFNCPGQIVISGDKEKVMAAVKALKERGLRKVIPLKVAGAFHSRLMQEAGEQLMTVLGDTPMQLPAVPVYHNFTAAPAKDDTEMRANLKAQVAGSVRWEECVRNMIALGADTMIEFGPGNVLTGLLRRTDKAIKFFNINSAETLENFSE
ncbi:ACP S-malonyltransferase [Lentisphaerota bacterium ZTH]|nr:ACP S-malonyltransferase [Lentisphaerota bacterium]WET06526.1 ACP S-malonyltransferase [Lentisphaerota bacterium ZTH]